MEGENIKFHINEFLENNKQSQNSLENKINNFQANIEKLNKIKTNMGYDLNELKKEFEKLKQIDNTKSFGDVKPTKRYDIYATVYVSNDLCDFLNLTKGCLYKKSDIVFKVFKYIKQEKLSYFGGHFIVDLKLRKIFPQNGDYYTKNDKFFKFSNIYKLLSSHITYRNNLGSLI